MKVRRGFAVASLGLAVLGASTAGAVDWTLIVAPARPSVMQVMFDVLRHRSAVLVSYQGDAKEAQPALHVWNGEEWTAISMRDLAEVRFVQVVPSRVVLVGGETDLPPALADATAWCARTAAIGALDTPTLINDLGRLFQFSRTEWNWFAARYRLTLQDRQAAGRGASWYDRPSNAPPPPVLPLFRRHRAVPAAPAPAACEEAPPPAAFLVPEAAPAPPAPTEPIPASPEEAAPAPAPAETAAPTGTAVAAVSPATAPVPVTPVVPKPAAAAPTPVTPVVPELPTAAGTAPIEAGIK